MIPWPAGIVAATFDHFHKVFRSHDYAVPNPCLAAQIAYGYHAVRSTQMPFAFTLMPTRTTSDLLRTLAMPYAIATGRS